MMPEIPLGLFSLTAGISNEIPVFSVGPSAAGNQDNTQPTWQTARFGPLYYP
jgi:hypothetical protein